MSNKANVKFAKFTANKTPLYKYNRLGTSASLKTGTTKKVSGNSAIEQILKKKRGEI